MQRLGLDNEALGEVLAVVGLFNLMNSLADAYQVEPDIWRALATHPEHLQLCWARLKAIMRPGKLDLLTKEIIAVAVSVTNSCRY